MTDQPIRQYPDELRERAEADTDAIGSTGEQLPPDVLALIEVRTYLSTACETADACVDAIPRRLDRETELGEWADRLHARCRKNNKFTGALCLCTCHDEAASAYDQAVQRVESSDTTPAATEATDTPDMITDPAWLRQQYAAALREHGMVHRSDQVPADEYDCCADAVLAVRDRHLQQLRQRLTLAAADLDRYEEHVVGDLNEANIGLARQAARAEQQRNQLAADLRYALDDHGPRHTHKQPGTWDDTGAPCAHCIRLEQARQHLTNLKPTEA